MESAKSRFLRYVTYYTTSDEFTGTSPSTERQQDLGRATHLTRAQNHQTLLHAPHLPSWMA